MKQADQLLNELDDVKRKLRDVIVSRVDEWHLGVRGLIQWERAKMARHREGLPWKTYSEHAYIVAGLIEIGRQLESESRKSDVPYAAEGIGAAAITSIIHKLSNSMSVWHSSSDHYQWRDDYLKDGWRK